VSDRDNRAFVDRLLRQMLAFDSITVECSRCHQQARLARLIPTARGLHCERCLVAMPTGEFRDLQAENARVNTSACS
jgi:hypothetical protein